MIETALANKEFVGILISLFSIVIPLAIFILTKNKEQEQLNFERFHKDLMRGLANVKSDTGLDQQVAIIYELRNYPTYYPVIKRILVAQISRWKNEVKAKPHFNQLIDEAQETINFSQKNFLWRRLIRLFPQT